MNRQVIMLIMVIGLVILVAVQAFQISQLKSSFTGDVVNEGDGETYEEMTARMHPDQIKTAKGSTSTPAMVGGC